MKFVMDERIKHRLTGLIVIISIAAIFLPAAMKKSNQRLEERVNISVSLPAKPALPKVAVIDEKKMFQSVKVAKVDIPAVAEGAPVTQIAKAEPISIKPVAPAVLKEPVLAKAESVIVPVVHATAVSTKLVKEEAASKAVYAVQLASFSQLSNAQSLVTRLRSAGFKATYNRSNGKREFYKVIVGDFKQRDEALHLKKQLLASTQLNGVIIKTEVS